MPQRFPDTPDALQRGLQHLCTISLSIYSHEHGNEFPEFLSSAVLPLTSTTKLSETFSERKE